jgi:hypothetical protein
MRTLWIIAGIALLVSLAADRRKTRAAVNDKDFSHPCGKQISHPPSE